ncbi:MAG: glycosyltransferase [Candidatus Eisenbacteria bacterium]|nr:glycosyltransferase [Candidatus Latescibacterota bacterium]MBD3302541.1 glycosyltransferase [Candidatus Eisenbacteria bacterium]
MAPRPHREGGEEDGVRPVQPAAGAHPGDGPHPRQDGVLTGRSRVGLREDRVDPSSPEISILLPIRDAADTLDDCLASLVSQTFGDWECLAVDDGSGDATAAILRRWAKRDGRIRPLTAPGPGGIVVALEEARRHARAGFLARQDADDRSLPRRLEEQRHALRAAPALAVLGCRTTDDGPIQPGMRRYLDWLGTCTDPDRCAREIWIESPIAHPTAMIRAPWLERVGGYRERGWPEDYDLWLRIHRAGGGIASLPEVHYVWRDRPGRLSRRDPRYGPDAFLRCRVHHLRRRLAERGLDRPLIVWGAGRDGRRLARAWEEERLRPGPAARPIEGFIDIDPRKIGRTRRGVAVRSFEESREVVPDAFLLVAVGVAGAREEIRSSLREAGLREEDDFFCLH